LKPCNYAVLQLIMSSSRYLLNSEFIVLDYGSTEEKSK
jgi:hypothetical protein